METFVPEWWRSSINCDTMSSKPIQLSNCVHIFPLEADVAERILPSELLLARTVLTIETQF
jgi:hypothetical protein